MKLSNTLKQVLHFKTRRWRWKFKSQSKTSIILVYLSQVTVCLVSYILLRTFYEDKEGLFVFCLFVWVFFMLTNISRKKKPHPPKIHSTNLYYKARGRGTHIWKWRTYECHKHLRCRGPFGDKLRQKRGLSVTKRAKIGGLSVKCIKNRGF